jgi:prepilin-type N-terminal cleavage/methylation domain-containing protein
MRWHRPKHQSSGVTLIELICVMVIIAILMAMLLPTITRAYSRITGQAEEWEASEIEDLLLKETRGYCTANPQFKFDSKSDFADKCALAPKCRDWVNASRTEFVPFTFQDSTNKLVLSVHIGRNHATEYDFTKGQISIDPRR